MNKNLKLQIIFLALIVLVLPMVQAADNIYGWTTSENIEKDASNNLSVTGPGTLITNYTFDILANTNYTFSYNGEITQGCALKVNFADNSCLSNKTFRWENCFISPIITLTGANKLAVFNLTSNEHAINGVYFQDVKLNLSFEGSCSNIRLANISLKEQKYSLDNAQFNSPNIAAIDESSCCPSDYCWNGTVCVDSALWTKNPREKGIWSTTSGSGYRCVITNTVTNNAEWVFSTPKYDWNNKNSGYCSNNTNCFVTVSGLSPINGVSSGCVPNGTFVNDTFNINAGNHYCYDGAWTTKTYIVAKELLNMTEGLPYILSCYNDTSVTFNSNGNVQSNYNKDILSTCVLIKQKSSTDEQVITGIITDNPNQVLIYLVSTYYNPTYAGLKNKPLKEYADISKCELISGNFLECFRSDDSNPTPAPMHIYYENKSKYFIISEESLSFGNPGLWGSIINFFKKLFTSSSGVVVSNLPLTDYENIYLVNTPNGTITAVEEDKFNGTVMNTVLFVQYNCSNSTYNVINKDSIVAYVRNLDSSATVVYSDTVKQQNLTITTKIRTNLWPYLTSSLRHRTDSGFTCG